MTLLTIMHRFSLGKMVTVCPQCHHRSFKPYVDNASGRALDAQVCGRCNREVKCKYHFTPAQWFEAGGKVAAPPAGWTPPPPLPPDFVEVPKIRQTAMLEDDALFRWLCGFFPKERVREVFAEYGVRHARWNGGATAFFLTDEEGRCRSAKLMRYGADGHRRKNGRPQDNVSWMHTVCGYRGFRFRACFFGAHLAAKYPDRTLCLVESEKTALIMALEDESGLFTFMATGGASALMPRPEVLADPWGRLRPLKGRHLILYPDADMVDRWMEAANGLRGWCKTVQLCDVRNLPWGLTGSADMGDLIIERRGHCRLTTT